MKKVKFILILLLLCIIFVAVACAARWIWFHSPHFEKYDPMFVNRFSNEDDIDSIHVSSLVAYYHKDNYYYTVTYTQDGSDFIYELLYIFRYEGNGPFFSIKDEAECHTYFESDYKAYLTAKEKGKVKVYSDKEIADMINDFYGRTIVTNSD